MAAEDDKKNDGKTPKSFDDLIEKTASEFELKKIAKQKDRVKRVAVNIGAVIETQTEAFVVNVVDISAFGLKIDKEISNSHNSRCVVTLKTKPPLPLQCIPFTGELEVMKGSWSRLKIIKPIDIDKTVALIEASTKKP
jgi:hypothetical protein